MQTALLHTEGYTCLGPVLPLRNTHAPSPLPCCICSLPAHRPSIDWPRGGVLQWRTYLLDINRIAVCRKPLFPCLILSIYFLIFSLSFILCLLSALFELVKQAKVNIWTSSISSPFTRQLRRSNGAWFNQRPSTRVSEYLEVTRIQLLTNYKMCWPVRK